MLNLLVLSSYKSLSRKVAFSRQTAVSRDQLFTDYTVTVNVPGREDEVAMHCIYISDS